ncbi:MAG: hypothetical protein WCK83_00710 [Burkholderiales bacterium]|nr:hypothetical protein [Burkholderiales bacterium]
MFSRLIPLALVLSLAGCDLAEMLADPKVAQRIADAKAIGSACRHGMRSIEDCYALNEKHSKSAIFDGWKEMDQYMRDNKIEGIEPKAGKGLSADEEIVPDSKDSKSADAKAKPKAKPKAP